MARTDRASRVIAAPPAFYRALLDHAAHVSRQHGDTGRAPTRSG